MDETIFNCLVFGAAGDTADRRDGDNWKGNYMVHKSGSNVISPKQG